MDYCNPAAVAPGKEGAMKNDLLEVERDGNIAVLRINRADKRNALNTPLREAIDAGLEGLEADDNVSAAVLLSKGPVFCAGFDTSEFAGGPDAMRKVFQSANTYHRRVADFSKPFVVGVQGPAMGGGFDLAVLCDIRIATPAATFAHPEVKFGAPVLFGPLREIIGGGLARDLALTGRTIDAQEAHRIGLVSQVVEPEALEETCVKTARTIAEAPLQTLKAVKAQIIRSFGGWDEQAGDGDDVLGLF